MTIKRQKPEQFIGQRIKRLRQQSGLSQRELAEAMGIKQSALSLLESGRTAQPSEMQLRKICAALRTDPNTLYGFTMVRPPD